MYQLYKKIFFLFLSTILLSFAATSQAVVDTFETYLAREKNDSTKISRAIEVSKYFETVDTAVAWKYFRIAKQMADKQNNITSKISVQELEGVLNTKTDPAKAYLLYNRAIALCEENPQVASLNTYRASLFNNLGVISYLNGDYEGAVNSFRESVSIYEKYYPAAPNLVPTLANISACYNVLNYPEKAVAYSFEALQYAKKYGNNVQKANAYHAYGNNLLGVKKYDSAFLMINEAQTFAAQTKNQYDLYTYYFSMGEYYGKKDNIDSCLYYFNKALPIVKALNYPYDIAQMLNNIANQEMDPLKNDILSAKIHLDSSNAIIEQYNFREIKKEWYQLMAEYARIKGNTKDGFEYLKKYDLIKDSLQNETSLKRIDFLEARYESEKKLTKIGSLEKEKEVQQLSLKQKSIINYVLIGFLSALVVVGFLGYRNFRNRSLLAKQQDELQQQRIRELEKDKQLVAVGSMLQGQEEERSRLAKDLHDGLGGLLSGVKFSLSNMKDNLIITPDNMTVFERSLDMLDTSIKELRRVAHNMMPEMLTKFGLDEALKEYCNTINTTNVVSVKYQSVGMDTRLEQSSEIIVYRIIQELLNNIMKHAAATEVIVQLVKEEERFSIIVEDNGKGFDQALLKDNKGAGLTSIQSRVDYLKGHLEIHSEAGKGTLINIEFKL
jgi:signal transduction histidine kinase